MLISFVHIFKKQVFLMNQFKLLSLSLKSNSLIKISEGGSI